MPQMTSFIMLLYYNYNIIFIPNMCHHHHQKIRWSLKGSSSTAAGDLSFRMRYVARLFSKPITRLSLEQTGFCVTTWLYFCIKLLPCLAQSVYICHTYETVTHTTPWLKWRETSCNLWARMTIISYICHLFKGLWSKCVFNLMHGNGCVQRHACTHTYSHLPKLQFLWCHIKSFFS